MQGLLRENLSSESLQWLEKAIAEERPYGAALLRNGTLLLLSRVETSDREEATAVVVDTGVASLQLVNLASAKRKISIRASVKRGLVALQGPRCSDGEYCESTVPFDPPMDQFAAKAVQLDCAFRVVAGGNEAIVVHGEKDGYSQFQARLSTEVQKGATGVAIKASDSKSIKHREEHDMKRDWLGAAVAIAKALPGGQAVVGAPEYLRQEERKKRANERIEEAIKRSQAITSEVLAGVMELKRDVSELRPELELLSAIIRLNRQSQDVTEPEVYRELGGEEWKILWSPDVLKRMLQAAFGSAEGVRWIYNAMEESGMHYARHEDHNRAINAAVDQLRRETRETAFKFFRSLYYRNEGVNGLGAVVASLENSNIN